jgi:hypothetical protein
MDRGFDRGSRKGGARWLCHRDRMLTAGYIIPRQAPVHNPYYFALYFSLCIKFQELNEIHLHIYIYIYLIPWVLLVWQDRVDCHAIEPRQKPSDYLLLARARKNTLILLLSCYYHMEYIWIIIGDRAKLGLDGLGLGWTTGRSSGCICPACVDWGLSVALDTSQVIDLLSRAHTCL